jgi:hypothetical protein
VSYILDLTKLTLGDVILCTGSSKGAKAIMMGTGSNYSHSMIYVQHAMIHAIPEGGVFSKNLQRELFETKDHIKVLRLKKPLPDHKMQKICNFARSKVGCLYSKKEAISTQLYSGSKKIAKTQKQFCSRLVAQAYASEDIQLVNNPNYCSPEDLNTSPLLEIVPNVNKIASHAEIERAQSYDPNEENQRATLEWLVKTRELAEERGFEIHSINDVPIFLSNCKSLDNTVCNYIRESGYLEHYKIVRKLNPYLYDLILFSSRLKAISIPGYKYISDEFNIEQGLVRLFTSNLLASKENLRLSGLNYFRLHIKLFENILNESKERLGILIQVSSEFSPPMINGIQSLINKIEEVI